MLFSKKSSSIAYYKLLEILNQREKFFAFLLFLASLITALFQAFGVFSIFPFINVIMNPTTIKSNKYLYWIYQNFNFSDYNEFLVFLGIFVFLSIVLSSIVSAFTFWAKNRYILGRNHSLSLRLFNCYLKQPYSFFLNRNSSELAKQILDEVSKLTDSYLFALSEIVINFLMLFFIVIVLLFIDTFSTVFVLLFLGILYISLNKFLKTKLRNKGKNRIKSNQLRYRTVLEAFSSIKITKIMNIEKFFLRKFEKDSKQYYNTMIYASTAGRIPHYLTETIIFGGLVFFVIYQILKGNNVNTLIPLISVFAFAGKKILPSIQTIYYSFSQLYFNQAIVDKIYDDFKLLDDRNIQNINDQTPIEFNHHIVFKNVFFKYDNTDRYILNDFNLSILKNTCIGIVGLTGSGKTTLVDLLMGLLSVSKGSILLDNQIVDQNVIHSWQSKIAYVPQDIYLSDDTISNNIAFGIEEKNIDKNRVIQVSKIAALDEFINYELPEKYDTFVGERGIRLSGGQKQRIGIARALYQNPEILIFDEASSALDGKTEELVFKNMRAYLNQCTIIMIAHRLNTLKDCHQIILLEEGKISAQDTYENLMKNNITFRELAKKKEVS